MICLYYIARLISKIIFIGLVLTIISCSNKSLEFWRQIPIQTARVPQHESFNQTFIIDTDKINKITQDDKKERARDQRMDDIFSKMLGTYNWQYLKNQYGIQSIRNELISGKIHLEGMLDFIIYFDNLSNNDQEHLIIEGSGRFFTIRDTTNAILMSGDFKILPQRYPIEILAQGCIPIDIILYITRIPGEKTYYTKSVLRYELFINLLREQEKTYSIDYSSEHPVYQIINYDKKDEYISDQIATITFDGNFQHIKLIDLSGSKFINNKYKLSPDEIAKMAKAKKSKRKQQCMHYNIRS